MTSLRDGIVVPKTDPRIKFRGALDSLQADILEVQLLASQLHEDFYVKALQEILDLTRELMAADVCGRKVTVPPLFGYSLDELHNQIHHVKETFGFEHPLPDYRMGALAIKLNTLRTRIRETELTSAESSEDIQHILNRLSSAVYWLFCKSLTDPSSPMSLRNR
jgi:ethanolamine utilization cobalamin adenosyltransferase